MKHLWAPWRLNYVRSLRTPRRASACFICDAIRSRADMKHLVVDRRERAICIMNRFPYNTGHLLIAPLSHKGELSDLKNGDFHAMFDMTREMVALVRKTFEPQGFNIGINMGDPAGTSLPSHLHIHIVPRWSGDTNFMPVIADAKVMPETINATLLRLKKEISLNKSRKISDNRKERRRK